jgi:hypothetical protein
VQIIRRRLGLGRADADRGMAMAVVLIFGMLIMILAATALTVAVGGLKKADPVRRVRRRRGLPGPALERHELLPLRQQGRALQRR